MEQQKEMLSISLGRCWADTLVCYIRPEIGILCCNFALRIVDPQDAGWTHFFVPGALIGLPLGPQALTWLVSPETFFVFHISRVHDKQCMQHPAFPAFSFFDFVGGFRTLWYSSPAPDSVPTPVLFAQKQDSQIQTLCGCRVHGSTPSPLFFFSRTFFPQKVSSGWLFYWAVSRQLHRRLRMCMKGWAKSKPQLLTGGLGDGW